MDEQEPKITLQDIAAAVKIIDLASARGAIKGEEMSAVGGVRNRLSSFIEYSQKMQEQEQQGETEEVSSAS
jgi:hypothetical protein